MFPDSISVHHQESSAVHTAIVIGHTGYADCFLAGSGWILITTHGPLNVKFSSLLSQIIANVPIMNDTIFRIVSATRPLLTRMVK